MTFLISVSLVLTMLGSAFFGVRLTIWAIALISFLLVATMIALVANGHLSVAQGIIDAAIMLVSLQAGYLGGSLIEAFSVETTTLPSATVSSRLRSASLKKIERHEG